MKRAFEFIKSYNPSRNVYICLYIICITLIGLCFGVNRTIISDYNPINGDWQNYNPLRRVLDGQVPFVDFPPYLGLGEILLNIVPLLFRNSFTMSLFITNFSAIICFLGQSLFLWDKGLRVYVWRLASINFKKKYSSSG